MKKNIVVLEERMDYEGRVALTPLQCLELVKLGHKVFVEAGAGKKSGFEDYHYQQLGARVLTIWDIVPLLQFSHTVVLKVKQPLTEDYVWLKKMKDGVLFAYFHSTGEKDRRTLDVLLKNKITAVSYELIQTADGTYPILVPMSEIAGRLAAEWGQKLSSDARVKVGKEPLLNRDLCMTVVGGAGTVGVAAVQKGLDRGFSRITVLEKDMKKRDAFFKRFTPKQTLLTQVEFYAEEGTADYENIVRLKLANTNLLVGGVLIPGGHAPLVVSKEHVKLMQSGSVIVDVAVDQGGCIWHPESETAATFEYGGKTFCRIPNMPGSVPKESAPRLAEAIFPYLLQSLKEEGGIVNAFRKNSALRKGVITNKGKVMNRQVAAYYGEYSWRFTDGMEG